MDNVTFADNVIKLAKETRKQIREGVFDGIARARAIKEFSEVLKLGPDGQELAEIISVLKQANVLREFWPLIKQRNRVLVSALKSAPTVKDMRVVLSFAQDDEGMIPPILWEEARNHLKDLVATARDPKQLAKLNELVNFAHEWGMWGGISEAVIEADQAIGDAIEQLIESNTILTNGDTEIIPSNIGHARKLLANGYTVKGELT